MNTRQYQYVTVLANELNFSCAAEKLGIKQPALSQYIKKIETELGTELFTRNGADMRLTETGKIYLESAKKILDTESQMTRRIDDIKNCRTGSVKIGLAEGCFTYLLPQVIRLFRVDYPGYSVTFEENKTELLKEGIDRGEYDFCIDECAFVKNDYSYNIISDDEMIVAVGKNTELCRWLLLENEEGEISNIESVFEKPLVGLHDIMDVSKNSKCCFATKASERIICPNIETVCLLASNGLSTAILYKKNIVGRNNSELRLFSLRKGTKTQIAAFWRREQYVSQAGRALLKIIADEIIKNQ